MRGSIKLIESCGYFRLPRGSSPCVAPKIIPSFDNTGVRTGHTGTSSQDYLTRDSGGRCYKRKLTSVNSILTANEDGGHCTDKFDPSRS
jgi:hypothetical protein